MKNSFVLFVFMFVFVSSLTAKETITINNTIRVQFPSKPIEKKNDDKTYLILKIGDKEFHCEYFSVKKISKITDPDKLKDVYMPYTIGKKLFYKYETIYQELILHDKLFINRVTFRDSNGQFVYFRMYFIRGFMYILSVNDKSFMPEGIFDEPSFLKTIGFVEEYTYDKDQKK